MVTGFGDAPSVTEAPPEGAAVLNPTVQVAETEGDIESGLQEKPLSPARSVTVPFTAAVETGTPAAALDMTFTSCSAAEGSGADGDVVNVRVATDPVDIPVAFKPHTTQVIGLELVQDKAFPAADTTGPADTLADVKSATG